ncbi:MAG: hypothetical protein KGK07_07300 [Chloroflexota bacterium]|nr:hypothetical protein [Chloroflexota bacterium]
MSALSISVKTLPFPGGGEVTAIEGVIPTSGNRVEFGIPPGSTLRDLAAAVLAALPDADARAVLEEEARRLGCEVMWRVVPANAAEERGPNA